MPDDRVSAGSRTTASQEVHRDERQSVLPRLPAGGPAFSSPLGLPTSDRIARQRKQIAVLLVVGGAFVSSAAVALALVVRAGRVREQPTPVQPSLTVDVGSVPPLAVRAIPELPVAAPVQPTALSGAIAAPGARAPSSGTGAQPVSTDAERSSRTMRAAEPLPERAARTDAIPGVRRKQRAAAGAPPLPLQPSRAQVIAAMQRVMPAVSACFGRRHGSAKVLVTVLGKTGRVTTARVSGQRGKIGSCIASAVRRARLPKFEQRKLEISYPFAR
jgi:hypothetical protein